MPSGGDNDLIRDLEARIASRCPPGEFDAELWRQAIANPDALVRAGGRCYRASYDLTELQISAANENLQTALAEIQEADTTASPRLHWWVYDLAADVAEERLCIDEALELLEHARSNALIDGLPEQWVSSTASQIFMLKRVGREKLLIERVQELAHTEAFGAAAKIQAAELTDLLQWIGQPGLSVEMRAQDAIRQGHRAPVETILAKLSTGDLAGVEALVQPDSLGLHPAPGVSPLLHAYKLLLAIRLRTRQERFDEAKSLIRLTEEFLADRDSINHTNKLHLGKARISLLEGQYAKALAEVAEIDDERAPIHQSLFVAQIYAECYAGLGQWADAIHWRHIEIKRAKRRSLGALAQAEITEILAATENGTRVGGAIEKRFSVLRDALREREAMTSLVAKDLRGPIFSIELASQLATSDKTEALSNLMEASLTWLELSVSELTDLDFLETFASTPAPSSTDVTATAEAAAAIVQPLLRGGSITVNPAEPGAPALVDALGGLLQRVLSYLIADVASHVTSGTNLTVSVRTSPTTVTVVVATAGNHADRGEPAGGAATMHRDHVVLRRIVHLIGGRVVDASTSDNDRVIRLTLPRHEPAATTPQ